MARRKKPSSPPWWNLGMLALESQQVIFMRLMKLSAGGSAAQAESNLMVSEKITEAISASHRMMLGASPDSIIRGYRKKVRANARRLAK